MKNQHGIAIAVLLLYAMPVSAQELELKRDNKRVEVTVTQKIEVEADTARVTFRTETFGQSHDTAYEENLRIAGQVVKALLDGGLSRNRIETREINSAMQTADDLKEFPPDQRLSRRFKVEQSWTVRVPAADAQRILDTAVKAGANRIIGVSWEMADPDALETSARRASIEKARAIAEEIAKGFGGKLGVLIFASNDAQSILYVPRAGLSEQSDKVHFIEQFWLRRSLDLFPQKIIREVTLHAVFALE